MPALWVTAHDGARCDAGSAFRLRTRPPARRRVDDLVQAIRAGTAKPVREGKRLTRLLTDRLESFDPGFGVKVMTLAAILAEPLA